MGSGTDRFILTGSVLPPDDTTRHTAAGRVSRLSMRPMSLFESGYSTGGMSLGVMLRGEPVPAQHSRTTVTNLVELVCRGGWPGMIGAATNDAQRFVLDYLEEIRRADIRRVDGIRRDPVLVRRVLQSLARNVATSGRSRRLNFGRVTVELRHAPQWQLAAPRRKAGDVIRALAWLGPQEVEEGLDAVPPELSVAEIDELAAGRPIMPNWMAESISAHLSHG